MKTYSARSGDIQREWLVVDAEGKTLGRLATQVATVLKGKHKPMYTPSMDTGDHVVVINAAKVALTGRKAQDKRYFHHTMYPGGASWTSIVEMMAKHPDRVVSKAVQGMLPRTKLGRAMFRKLKVYGGAEHPHAAQQPVPWTPGRKGARN
ncbi:MAG: 50S ribosomal protein L13 [Candidatus Eisenbacteria bacterium]|nr:50S ribosomal protein L13 [Candidatus Eisenbacteria bacterium]